MGIAPTKGGAAGLVVLLLAVMLGGVACAFQAGPSAKLRQQAVAHHQCMDRHGYPNHVSISGNSAGITFDHRPIKLTRKFEAALTACGLSATFPQPGPSG